MQTRCAFLVVAALTIDPSAASSQPAANSNVVVVQVQGVRLPVALPGSCKVKGVVSEVWEGTNYAPGQVLNIDVPCSDGRAHFDGGPEPKSNKSMPAKIDPSTLQRSKRGLAHLDDAGHLDWQASRDAHWPWGHVSGYRVMEAVGMPVTPAQTPL